MSLLGKILALVNILAAIGFIYLAASDYGKRQQWSYAVYRHDLALNGLPLDDNEKDVDGQPLVKNLNQATLTEVFQGAGQPVKTQMEEVQRVQNDLRGQIDNGQPMTVPNLFYGNPPTINLESAAQKRAWFLLPLARTLTERDALMTQLYSPKEEKINAEEFDNAFTNATAKRDPGDKRQAIASLLFGLLSATPGDGQQDVLDSPGYKHFVAVVGRQAAATAVADQADVLTQLAYETNDALGAGRNTFAAAHGRMVSRLRELADVMQHEKDALELQRNQTARQQELVNERDGQVKDLQARLAAAHKRTRAYLAEQQKLQQALLAEQRKLRDANSKNRELVGEIEKLEK
jgi:hypothetical protein